MRRPGTRDHVGRPAVLAGLLVVLIAAPGCASKRPDSFANRFVRGVDGPVAVSVPPELGGQPIDPSRLPPGDPVPKNVDLPRLENEASALKTALGALGRAASRDAFLGVATEYHRLGVFDQAHDYLTQALKKYPKDAALMDARARVSRDWGLLDQALGDAHRAVYADPQSAAARNTLGTVHFALGQKPQAAAAFHAALAIDPGAVWAQSNLCFLALDGGDETAALNACRDALAQDDRLTAARNNLALIHAAAGRLDEARREFLAAGSPAAGYYNYGIVLMARREYQRAQEAFESALREAPGFDEAFARAQAARALAARARIGKETR